jgi:hypothetical protein
MATNVNWRRGIIMSLRNIIIVSVLLFCCSPQSIIEDNLIGSWIWLDSVLIPGFDSTGQPISVWDTVYYIHKVDFTSNQATFSKGVEYKTHPSLSHFNVNTYNYSKSTDTLKIELAVNRHSFLNYCISKDSLFLKYLYGDLLLLDSLTPLSSEIYERKGHEHIN